MLPFRMLRVYVAGASSEVERAERAIAALRRAGCVVTHDWTREVRDHRAKKIHDAEIGDHECREIAVADLAAVRRSNVLLLLVPEQPSQGAWVELGCASGVADLRIVACGPNMCCSIFTRIADVMLETDDAAIALLSQRPGDAS